MNTICKKAAIKKHFTCYIVAQEGISICFNYEWHLRFFKGTYVTCVIVGDPWAPYSVRKGLEGNQGKNHKVKIPFYLLWETKAK